MVVPIISILFVVLSVLGNLFSSYYKLDTLEERDVILYYIGLMILLSLPLLGVIAYLVSPLIVNKKDKIELAKVYPDVYSNIMNLCKELKITKIPKCYAVNTVENYCYVFGRNLRKGNLIITSNLIKILDKEQLEVVILHEIAHIKHSDVGFMTWANTFLIMFRYWVVFFVVSIVLSYFLVSSNPVQDAISWFRQSVLVGIGFLALPYISITSVSRIRENLADAEVLLHRPAGLMKSTIKEIAIESLGNSLIFKKRKSGILATLKCKVPKFVRTYIIDTHPSLSERLVNIESHRYVYNESKFWHITTETAIYAGAISAYVVYFSWLGMFFLSGGDTKEISIYILVFFLVPTIIISLVNVYPLRYSAEKQITTVTGISWKSLRDSFSLVYRAGFQTSLIGVVSYGVFSILYGAIVNGLSQDLLYLFPMLVLFQGLLVLLVHAVAILMKVHNAPATNK